jgi:hypothetical protein
MLDNLRKETDDTSFFKEEEEQPPEEPEQKPRKVRRRRTFDQITGMTAFQRFILAVMLLITVCLLGSMLLILTGKVIPTFLH